MADSTRHLIMDSVVSALSTISSLHVNETIVGWEEAQPKGAQAIFAYPIDGEESRMAFSLYGGVPGTAAKATLSFVVTCYCFRDDNSGSKLRKLRTDLIQNIEAALQVATTLWGYLLDLRPIRVSTDMGVIPKYSIFDYTFEADYLYQHTTGG